MSVTIIGAPIMGLPFSSINVMLVLAWLGVPLFRVAVNIVVILSTVISASVVVLLYFSFPE